MRLFLSLMATVSVLFAATAASAFTFIATPTTAGPYAVGDTVTVDIVMSRDGTEAIGSIGAIAIFDPAILAFNSGVAVPNAASTGPLFFGVLPTNPITNGAGAVGAPNPAGNGQNNRNIGAGDVIAAGVVEFFTGVQAILPTPSGDDTMDMGYDGIAISAGGLSATLVFDVIGAGTTDLIVGGDGNLGGVVDGAGNANIQTNAVVPIVVPEPGTALLMGLGLAGLGMAGRRD